MIFVIETFNIGIHVLLIINISTQTHTHTQKGTMIHQKIIIITATHL